jgi:glucose 1-dehydrogenase
MPPKLHDQIAIVTGGESGIGAATARALGAAGAAIAINYLDKREDAEGVRDDVIRTGARAIIIAGDVGHEDDVIRLFATCATELGTPTILINSAGINGKSVQVADMTADQWDTMLRANLRSTFLCAREFVRARRAKTGSGRIVNVTSIHEDIVVAGFADYDVSKAGMHALTRTLAVEVGALGITVNSVAPGMILTAMNQVAQDDPNALESKTSHIPLRRAGKPEEVAALISYVCTNEAGYISGASLRIDGGLSLNSGQGA